MTDSLGRAGTAAGETPAASAFVYHGFNAENAWGQCLHCGESLRHDIHDDIGREYQPFLACTVACAVDPGYYGVNEGRAAALGLEAAMAADPLVRVAVGSGVELIAQSEIDQSPWIFPCERCGMQSMSHLCTGTAR